MFRVGDIVRVYSLQSFKRDLVSVAVSRANEYGQTAIDLYYEVYPEQLRRVESLTSLKASE